MRFRNGMTAARRDLRKLASLLAAAGAAVSLAAAPASPPPASFVPAKGQAVYVAAALKEIRHKGGQPGGPKMTYDMAACEKLVVRKGNAGKRSWTFEDLMGNEVRLQGTWQPWMFRTKEECRNAITRRGEAPVKKAGDVFTVTTAPPPK